MGQSFQKSELGHEHSAKPLTFNPVQLAALCGEGGTRISRALLGREGF